MEARIDAAPTPLRWDDPGAPADYEYRRIKVTGTYRPAAETLTQAVTERGGGFWVMTPLVTPQGTVLVNRGFVPADRRRAPEARAPTGPVTLVGLLRAPEPGGGFLRTNDPVLDRWYSRDIAAIARARHLGRVAPFFIDEQARFDRNALPVAGLTVVRFPNNHLIYALTWFGLAGLCAFAAFRVFSDRERL